MAKFQRHILRRDTLPQDHVHSLPNGKPTMGVQYKPNANQRAGWHSHLYEHDGDVYETDAAYEGVDHVHHAHEFPGSMPVTSGPQHYPKHKGVELGREEDSESA